METPRFSLRKKIILSFLLVILFGGVISLFLGYRLVKNTLISQAQTKVKHDLSAAWMVFNEKLNSIKEIVSLTAVREEIQHSLESGNPQEALKYLSKVRQEYGLDILNLTDSRGIVMIRTRNPEVRGDDRSADPLIQSALQGEIVSRPQIVPESELEKEGGDLAAQAAINIISTPNTSEPSQSRLVNGMMLKTAAPVRGNDGRVLGTLCGGVLLNRNYEIVDRIKETVYKEEKYEGREIGTATIFQNDLRISTNVKNKNGTRAVGTRVSDKVRQAVLQEGKPWVDRAFVVNDWYITAYDPIKNIQNQIIGILYVGILEKPYIDTTNRVMLTFTLLAAACVIVLLVLLDFSTKKIIHPLLNMVKATEKISQGNLSHKVKVDSNDEIGYLADSFNKMTEDLKAANHKLLEWGKTLEKKVEERTKELTEMHAHLIQSEKLASLGKLAAGVAHEINNPLGGILIYSHLLLEDMDKDDIHYENLKKIVKETTRCKDIVKGLLDFARPKEPEATMVNVNNVVEKAMSIVESQALFQNINIKKDYMNNPPQIIADASQLHQVFINIILNAAEAMQGNGTLTISTFTDKNKKSIHVRFSDTGPGIEDKTKARLFEPFFTTKEVGKGTGLGLAISYSLIRKHKGTIEVETQVGRGSTFTVKLPIPEQSSGANHE
ncbi:MAG: cache domain-containing protein [Candidatus Aminicenantes bacterium]